MGRKIECYRDLLVWQKAMELVTEVYRVTGRFPDDEKFGITAQIRRAAVSVPSNIAEGYGRNMLKDYIRFLRVARGSLLELETQVIISKNLKYISGEVLKETLGKTDEISRMLNGLMKRLEGREK